MNDREFLEDVARRCAEIDILQPGEKERLLELAERRRLEVQVVEQRTAMKTAGAAPDGWSWTDVNECGVFTGYYGGIRLQRGEPALEQDGHILLFRQGETSFTPRQVPIYRRIASLEGVDVVVVNGFLGARSWFKTFQGGAEGPMRDWVEFSGWLGSWLRAAHASPVDGWKRKQPAQAPRQPKLPIS